MTQKEVADAVRLSLNGYRKYERGQIDSPGIRQLANLAIVFGCQVEDLIEDEWRAGDWWAIGNLGDPSRLWRTAGSD